MELTTNFPFIKFKEKIREIDWRSVPTGTSFKATIHDTECEGLIFNNYEYKNVYLCQDNRIGSTGPSTLGFKYSWVIEYSCNNDTDLKNSPSVLVENLEFGPIPPDFKVPVFFPHKIIGIYPTISKGGVTISGYGFIPNEDIRLLVKYLKD